MSVQAINWAFSLQIRSSAKLVLLAMANKTTDDLSFLCIKSIETYTSLDRKTIFRCLADLEKAGLIIDTGEKRGITGQIKVYKLTVPKAEQFPKRNGSVFPSKQSQFSLETVPKTEHVHQYIPNETKGRRTPRDLAQEILNLKDVLSVNRDRVEKLKRSHYHTDTRTWNNEEAQKEVSSRRKNITKLEKQMADLCP